MSEWKRERKRKKEGNKIWLDGITHKMTTLFLENCVLKKKREKRIQNDVMCSKFTLHNRTHPVRTYTVSSVVHTAYLQIVRAYINNNLWHSTVGVGETEEKWGSTGVIEREQNDMSLPRARSLPRSIAHVHTSRHITHYFAFFRCRFVLVFFSFASHSFRSCDGE